MPIHRLTTAVVGVPDVEATARFYRDFGLAELGPGRFGTVDGGEQLRLVSAPRRRLLELGIGVDDPDDLERVARSLQRFGVDVTRDTGAVVAVDPPSDTRVRVDVASPLHQEAGPATAVNRPGAVARQASRAPALLRDGPVAPRKLGHVVIGSPDALASRRFFQEGLGFKVSDEVAGIAAFLRCTSDHHNLLVQQAPVPFLHHTSWQVEDVDEIGRGASAVLAADPARHVWGLGRHYIGSNYFWYLRDPAGNFAEYYADLDVIVDDQLWRPEVFTDHRALYAWGPPPPPSFVKPDDLAELMAS